MSRQVGPDLSRLAHDLEVIRGRPELALDLVQDAGGGVALVGTVTVTLPSSVAFPIQTRIEIPPAYPRTEPRAYEIGGRFAHTPERHFYPDGQACLWLAAFESKWRPKDPDALGVFIDELLAFYLRQLIYDADPSSGFPGPWRGHGAVGVIEHLEDALDVPVERLPAMARALSGGVYRNALCPCGQGIRYRKCHRDRVSAYRESAGRDAVDKVVAELRGIRSLRLPDRLRGRRPVSARPQRPRKRSV